MRGIVRGLVVRGGGAATGGGGGTFSGGLSNLGNTAGDTGAVTGRLVLVGSDNITLSGSTNAGSITVSILGGAGGAAGSNTLGMSNLGNTSGTSGVISGTALRYLFAGGNNVTLSQSINGASATLTISAFNQTVQSQNLHNLTLSGNTAGAMAHVSSGTLTLAGGNNITLSQAGNAVTISGAATVAQTVQPGIQSVSAGTTRVTTGEVVFSNSNGMSFGANGQTITGSYTVPTVPAQFTGGFSTQGNTAGDTGLVTGRLVLVGGNNMTLSGSTNGGSITITFSGGAAGGADGFNRIAAGTQTAETLGTIVFSDSHNVTFGMSGSTRVTASASFPSQTVQPGIQSISAGTTRATTGEVIFSNSNGISFAMNAGTVTASYTVPSVPPETPFGVSAGTQSVSTGTLVFSNSHNITFGMSGSSRVTASASFPAQVAFGISAGTQSVSTGTLVFSDSNGISFGMSGSSRVTASYTVPTVPAQFSGGISGGNTAGDTGVVTARLVFHGSNNITLSGSTNGGSQTISIIGPTVPVISFHHVLPRAGAGTAALDLTHASMSNATLWLFPLAAGNDIFPGNMTFGTVVVPMFGSHSNATASTEAHTSTISFGIYRLNNRTQLTRHASGSSTWGSGANAGISSHYTGNRWLTLQGSQFDVSSLSNTNYWGALWFRTSGTQIATNLHGPIAARFAWGALSNGFSGFWRAASSSAASYAVGVPFQGLYSASFTTAMPAAIAQSEMAYTGTNWGALIPDVRLIASDASNIYGLV